MLPVAKLQAVKHIVSHENCPDGIASAMILKNVLPDAKVTFLQYETPEHKGLVPEEGMLFCDFSPHKSRVVDFKEAGALVLDHHKSQEAVVELFGPNGVFADEKAEPGVCGAVLAFREVWEPLMKATGIPDDFRPFIRELIRDFATLAGIRDTWQRKDPRWIAACEQAEALPFWPIETLLDLAPEQWAQKLELGPILYAKRLKSAEKCIEKSFQFWTTAKQRRVVVFDGLKQSSDAAEMLGDKADFVVGLGMTVENNDPQIIYSSRSHTGFNCSAFALAHGGGGHTAAAGCKLPLMDTRLEPFSLLQHLLGLYEQVEDSWIGFVTQKQKEQKQDPELKVDYLGEYNKLLQGKDIRDDYVLHLNRYQRDNLVWLLTACGYPADMPGLVVPFVFANTGDWLGEVANMLECDKGVGNPNMSLVELKEHIDAWRQR